MPCGGIGFVALIALAPAKQSEERAFAAGL
jgi:hypothetical protein